MNDREREIRRSLEKDSDNMLKVKLELQIAKIEKIQIMMLFIEAEMKKRNIALHKKQITILHLPE